MMSFTVNDFEDLLRLLEQQPLWLARLRSLVLPEELLTLPELVRELVEAQRRTEQRVAELVEAQRASDARIDRLAELYERLAADVGVLKTDVSELKSDVSVLKTDVGELKTDVSILKTDVSELKTDVSVLKTDVSILKTDVSELKTDVSVLKTDVSELKTDTGRLKGDSLEVRYRTRGAAYFSRIVRRARVLTVDEHMALLDAAAERGALSRSEVDEMSYTDIVIQGRRGDPPQEVYLVVEVSWTIDEDDVERAARRAALFARTGVAAIPVVAGSMVDPRTAERARAAGVWQVTDGRVAAPA